jgi:DNA topoisomerase-1
MTDAEYTTILAKIKAPYDYEYKYTCEEIVFEGWKIIELQKKGKIVDDKAREAYYYLPKIKDCEKMEYKKIISKLTLKELKMHYTEAKLVQLLEQKGIGRPSTFSSLIEKIQERGYVKKDNIKGKKIKCLDFELENDEILEIETEREFGNENNKLILEPVGKLVIEYLLSKYKELFDYNYTKNMEDKLDEIAKGELEYQDLCKECLESINKELKIEEKKEIFKIDEDHVYMIGKNGPVIKRNDNKFLSVKEDIDIDKLREGKYNLEDIIENRLEKEIGIYENSKLYLKKGKFGLYAEWGSNKKSLNGIDKNKDDITIDDIVKIINNNLTNNLVRKLSNEISIRKGKYGDYIFYKTEKMKNPKFFKINIYNGDYINDEIAKILEWININYKI